MNRVYWETSWFSAIYAGKIAFFTFGHFVGSNFDKPRPVKSRVRFMYEMQHFVHNFPLTREQGLLRDQPFMQVKLHFLHLDTSWVLTLTNQDQSSQESVWCTKCSISYIISRWPVNRVYWETSWFSAIYAGKIAFFTFGHFVGSNFDKPRPVKSRVRFMYEMQHFVHNFPLTREQGLLRDFLIFSHLCR